MPSFSIEVPGEANPLTENLLVHSLTSAASRDPGQIQTGTKQLQQWEKSPGFYRHLQSAYIDIRLPLEIRYLAIIQLKNGIDKYWRKTALNAVSKDDKDAIRSRLIDSALNEQDNRLALQNALVVAKIARFEYPQDWPDVLTSLSTTLRSQLPPLQLARALLVLLHIIKELSTARLQRSRRDLQSAATEIVHVLGTLYAHSVEQWRHGVSQDVEISMHQSLLAMKVLRRLLISGYEHPNRNNEVVAVWQLTQEHLGAFVQLEKTGHASIDLIEKHMIQLAKLHHEMARDHPAAFALLSNSVALVQAYWGLAKGFGEVFGTKEVVTSAVASARIGTDGDINEGKKRDEKLTLKALLILRACVRMVHNPTQTFKYRTPEDKEEKSRATTILRNELLTNEFLQELMEILITRFFVFRASDLKEWEEEPEEWEKREEGDGEDWEFSVRSCSEKLFLDLSINYKAMLVQPLLQVFYSVARLDNENVLFKDSVYTAIGLAAPVLHEHLDFDAFIRDVLVGEIQKQHPGYNILRRRAAILLGQWISVKVSESSRPAVYEIFQHLLNKDDTLNDQVVRVTAGRQFKNICESWEFQAEAFMPYAENTIARLLSLVDEVELSETKLALLNTISVVVENLDSRIAPFAEHIVNVLPSLSEESGEEHLMEQAILTILARLITAMKADSLPMHHLVFPIIHGAVRPGSKTEVYLLDDAMDLWASMVVQTPAPASSDLLFLAPFLLPIYQIGSENMRKAIEITESYLLLAPEYMLSEELRADLFLALFDLYGHLKPDAIGLVCNLVETVIRVAERLGGEAAVTQMSADLVQAGIVGKLLGGLRGSFIAHCTTGPNKTEPPVDGMVETDYFSILARLILGSLDGFCQAIQSAAPVIDPDSNSPPDMNTTMAWLLEEWMSHWENVGDPSRRKLMCLALTKLLQTNHPFILDKLQLLMVIWTDAITELREDDADTNGGFSKSDSLTYSSDAAAAETGYEQSPEDLRRRELMYADVVHMTDLPAFVKQHLESVVEKQGGMESFTERWLVNVDQDVSQAFVRLNVLS